MRRLRPEIEVLTCPEMRLELEPVNRVFTRLHLSSSHLKRDFPPHPLLPYPAHVSYAYHTRGIDWPSGAAITKTRFLSAAGQHVTLPGLAVRAVRAGVRWGRPRSTTGSAPGRNGLLGGTPEGYNQIVAPAAGRMACRALQGELF